MKILGIDPGLQRTGWGIIESQGHKLSFCAAGLISPPTKDPLPNRLALLHEELSKVIKLWNPDTAAVEETFVNKNPASTLKLGQARGVVLAVPALHGIPTAEYSANQVKKSVVGAGHATKDQIGMMVSNLLPKIKESRGALNADEADALAIAITHAHYGHWDSVLAQA